MPKEGDANATETALDIDHRMSTTRQCFSMCFCLFNSCLLASTVRQIYCIDLNVVAEAVVDADASCITITTAIAAGQT